MYKNTNQKEAKQREKEKNVIRIYNYMKCFSNDYRLIKTTTPSRLSQHIINYSRLYYKPEDKKYYTFTKIFLDVALPMIDARKNRDFDKVFLDLIFDKIDELIKEKKIITNMKFLDDEKRKQGEKISPNRYEKLLYHIIQNKKSYDKIIGLSSSKLDDIFQDNIIDPYGSLDCFISRHENKYIKFETKRDFLEYCLCCESD